MLAIIIILSLIIIAYCILKLFSKVPIGKFWNYVTIISVIFVGISLVILPFSRMTYSSKIQQYNIFKTTLYGLKKQEDGLKSTFISQEIITINKELAASKYWNETIFDIYILDDYANLSYIKPETSKKKIRKIIWEEERPIKNIEEIEKENEKN